MWHKHLSTAELAKSELVDEAAVLSSFTCCHSDRRQLPSHVASLAPSCLWTQQSYQSMPSVTRTMCSLSHKIHACQALALYGAGREACFLYETQRNQIVASLPTRLPPWVASLAMALSWDQLQLSVCLLPRNATNAAGDHRLVQGGHT